MKRNARLLALVLAALMLIGVFASCSEKPEDEEKGDYVGVGEWDGTRENTPDLLPDDLDFDGAVISVLHREGLQENECEGEMGEADIVHQAVFERNLRVEARLNIDFNWVPTKSGGLQETKNEIVTELSAFTDDYDFILTTNNTILSSGMNAYLWDFNSAMYIDLTQPWWWISCMDEMSFDGVTYNFLVGEMNLTNFHKMSAFYFNTELVEQFLQMTPGDMYDMVDEGKWTLDQLHLMVSKCYFDKNGNTMADVGDIFGMPIAGTETITQLAFSTKFDVYKRFPNGRVEILLNNNRMISVVEKLTKLMHQNKGVYIQNSVNGSTGFDGFVITDFTEGKYVFMAQRFTAVCSEDMRQMETDYGIIPYPTLEEGDEYVSYIQSSSTCMSVPYAVDQDRFDRVCAVLEALSAEAYRSVTEKFYELALKSKYVRDDYDSPRMIDIIYNTSTKYFIDEYNSEAGGIFGIVADSIINQKSVTTAYASKGEAAQNAINHFIMECIAAWRGQ